MSASSGSGFEWPSVTDADAERPRAVDQGTDEDLVLARPREVIAYGTVNTIPWWIQGYVTAPGPNAKWWLHGPVGPELEFLLGKDGWFGGGGAGTWIPEGTDFTASVHFFGALPEIVAWVGVASERTDHLEVRLDDGSSHRVELRAGPEGFLRFFCLFPPRGATGVIAAVDADGRDLQREPLIDRQVPADANVGTTVNAFGYTGDSPPPGWPEERDRVRARRRSRVGGGLLPPRR